MRIDGSVLRSNPQVCLSDDVADEWSLVTNTKYSHAAWLSCLQAWLTKTLPLFCFINFSSSHNYSRLPCTTNNVPSSVEIKDCHLCALAWLQIRLITRAQKASVDQWLTEVWPGLVSWLLVWPRLTLSRLNLFNPIKESVTAPVWSPNHNTSQPQISFYLVHQTDNT